MPEPAAGKGTLIEHMRAHKAPIADLIGFFVTESGEGRAAVVIQTGPQHFNPMGTLHGGVLCDIADTAMGFAFASTLAAGESFTTIELKINYLRPVREAKLCAEGRVVQAALAPGSVLGPAQESGWFVLARETALQERPERVPI